jgi:hypothetical protein
MATVTSCFRFQVAMAISVTVAWSAIASTGTAQTLNPKRYASPSGRHGLFVDPSSLDGRGGAAYRWSSEGRVTWSGEKPYTLWKAAVTDDGVAGGYAYSNGPEGFSGAPGDRSMGDFRVVILDAKGKERLDHATKRQGSNFLHTLPNPLAVALFMDAGNDRMVVRVHDEDVNRSAEGWWPYRISTGQPLATFRPKELMPQSDAARSILDARPVLETPLTLLHWWRYDWNKPGVLGARFTLIGLDGKPVWSLERPDDYSIPGDREAEVSQMHRIWQTGAILPSDGPGRFVLRFMKPAERVTFAVSRGPDGKWNVSEADRRRYVEPAAPATTTTEIPEKALRLLGRIELKAPATGPPPAVRGVNHFVFDDRGRIAFPRVVGEKAPELVVVDQSGGVVKTIRLDPTHAENRAGWSAVAWVGGDRYLLLRDDPNDENRMEAFRVDVAAGTAMRVAGFSTTVLSKAAGFADGRFVVKGGLSYFPGGATSDHSLSAFDAGAHRLWKIDGNGDHKDPAALFSPEAIAVTTDGKVAVLDNIRKTLQFFGGDGKFIRAIDLKKAWGREPNYPSGLSPDRDGGVLIHDFQGQPPLVRMSAAGAMRGGVRPRHPDGREFRISVAQVAPDGSIWVSDGHALMRLAESGVVERVLGERPDPARLGDIAGVTVDGQGRIYAVAPRTGAVHVFGPDGQWLRVCSPSPSDVPEEISLPHVTVSNTGDVYLGLGLVGSSRYLHFSPQGACVGVESLGLDDVKQDWYFQPNSDLRWVLGYDRVILVDRAGKVVHTVTRRPDGQWLERPENASVAADGSIAVVSRGTSGPIVVSLFSPTGVPVRSFSLPETVAWSFPRLAYDGKLVVVAGEKEVVVFDTTGKALQRFAPTGESGAWWTPFHAPGRREILLFDGRNTLLRYAPP